jgi:hypothetical protein
MGTMTKSPCSGKKYLVDINQLSSQIIKAAINVHKELAHPPRLSEQI